jgi:hypothetical protein
VAEHLHRHRLFRVLDDLRALFEHHFRVLGLEADQLLAALGDKVGALQAADADKIGLLLADRPVEPGVVGVTVPSVSWPTMM